MIEMAQIKYIKYLWENEDKSLREIARTCGLNFRTVQKYATREDWTEPEPKERSRAYPVLGEYIETVDKWLENDLKEPRKQRHTVKQIHKRLQKEKGFTGSYGSVKKYVRKKKEKMRQVMEGYLPLAHPPGHAQVDFGEFKYIDGEGVPGKAFHLVVTFPHTNAGFVQVFKGQNQECLLEGLKRIFGHIGGVPKRIKADNMTTAVVKILKHGQRELSDGFTRFMLHYRFDAEFCNPKSGNEKGSVENKVGYSRRNFFVPVPVIEDFDTFNEQLFQQCHEDMDREHYLKKVSIRDLWEEEKQSLLSLPKYEYGVFKYETARINNYGYVQVDGNKYGVAPEFAKKQAQIKIMHDKVEIYCDHMLLKTYERSYSKGKEITDWKQYLNLLCKKPGGLEHTRFFHQMPKLWREYLQDTQGKERKSALMLLTEIVKSDNEDMGNSALELARLYGRSDTESVKQIYYSFVNGENRPKPLDLNVSTPMANYNPSLSAYDKLTGGEMR